MRSEVYEGLLKIAMNFNDCSDEVANIREAIVRNSNDDLCLTIKNYYMHHGLSKFIHEDIANCSQKYEIKGPIGLGLCLK